MEKEHARGMRGNPTPATTQVSAALTIWNWILEHGRPPKVNECRGRNGLLGYDLYYRVFATNNFSAGVIPMVSAICGSSVKMRHCLGYAKNGEDCPNSFPDMGKHIRLCETHRHLNQALPEHSIPMQVERLTLRQLGAGTGGWNQWQTWAQDIDWGGKPEP